MASFLYIHLAVLNVLCASLEVQHVTVAYALALTEAEVCKYNGRDRICFIVCAVSL